MSDEVLTYLAGSTPVEASQWSGLGDRSDLVRRYTASGRSGDTNCETCGYAMYEHGWIPGDGAGDTVCPGDYIVTTSTGDVFSTHAEDFHSTYKVKQE